MVNACADPDFFLSEREGGGVQAQRRENSLDFFMFVLGFFSPKFSGDAGGGSNYLRGGVQMLISIEFDRTCDLPGMGVRTPYFPPPLWIRTCITFKDYRIKSKGEESAAREEGNI